MKSLGVDHITLWRQGRYFLSLLHILKQLPGSVGTEVEASEVCAEHQQSDSRVTSPRKPRESASLYLFFYIFSN